MRRLEKHPDQPIVTLVYDPRTLLDRRKKRLLEGPWLEKVLGLAGVPRKHVGGFVYYELEDPATGVTRVSAESRGAFVLQPGTYGTATRPCALRSTVSGTGYNAEQLFERLFGKTKATLDRLGVTAPPMLDFVTARHKGAVKTADNFMRAVSRFDAPEVDRNGFDAVWVRAFCPDDAKAVTAHKDFDPSWWQPVEVDDHRRPLARWVEGVRWSATDEQAFLAAQRDVRKDRELELERRLRLTKAELRSELGL